MKQVAGIILGMLSLGYIGDLIGRKWGSVTTASLMFVGAILLTAADGVTIKGLAAMYMVAQVGSISMSISLKPHVRLSTFFPVISP